jgi:hypothetical protein
MAAVAQGSSYVTADLDICYQRQPHNYQRLSQALHPFQPQLRGASADLPFVLDAATLKAGLHFTLTTAGGDLDLMGEVTGLGDYEAVKAHAEEVDLYGYRVWVLTLAGLIRSKQAAGRPKDLRLLPRTPRPSGTANGVSGGGTVSGRQRRIALPSSEANTHLVT